MNSDNEEDNKKSVFSHDFDNTGTFQFIFKEPIIEGEPNFAMQKSMELGYDLKS